MSRPDYRTTPTLQDFFLVRKYTGCHSAVYCCLTELLELCHCYGETAEDTNNLRFMVMNIYEMGRINGIREERQRRKHPGGIHDGPDLKKPESC